MNATNQIQRADIPALGTPIAGGFAVVTYRDGDNEYLLIVSGKIGEFEGQWHPEYKDIAAARSCVDGLANTIAMAEAGSPIAQTALSLNLENYNDWHLPARDQLELLYRHLKPTTTENTCSFRDGDNPSALPPTYPYLEDSPAQTAIAEFQEDGAQAFDSRWYWSSTQYSAYGAYMQGFGGGYTHGDSKVVRDRARVVRRLLVI